MSFKKGYCGFLLLVFILSCQGSSFNRGTIIFFNGETNKKVKTIDIEIAQSSQERQKGLMNRKTLPENQGMLFIFEREQKASFWMKETSIPLSIAYIAKSGEIKEIHQLSPFDLNPVSSRHSILYALEVNQGFFKNENIKVGDWIKFERD